MNFELLPPPQVVSEVKCSNSKYVYSAKILSTKVHVTNVEKYFSLGKPGRAQMKCLSFKVQEMVLNGELRFSDLMLC